jgi:S1-C subfamily serine protease
MFSPRNSITTAIGAVFVALSLLVSPVTATAQGRPGLLPDFTDLYERQGPAVVSIDVTQKARRQRFPDISEDDPFYVGKPTFERRDIMNTEDRWPCCATAPYRG